MVHSDKNNDTVHQERLERTHEIIHHDDDHQYRRKGSIGIIKVIQMNVNTILTIFLCLMITIVAQFSFSPFLFKAKSCSSFIKIGIMPQFCGILANGGAIYS